MTAALEAVDLNISAGATPLVDSVSIAVDPGSILVIVGETGSGKSLLAQALMGTLPDELSWNGRIVLGGEDVGLRDPRVRRALWGRQMALLPQEPWVALDPLMRAHGQVADVHHYVHRRPRRTAREVASRALAALGLGDAAARRFPFQLSGGMAQRVAVAIAEAADAPVVIADEPTKGLDAGRRDEVACLLRRAAEGGAALLVITHDIAFARRLGGDLAVMLEARIVERGATAEVLSRPAHDYTKLLIAADPAGWTPARAAKGGRPLVAATGLGVTLGGRRLLNGLDVAIGEGEILAVTGPSGCGKTTLGNLLLGLRKPDAGSVSRTAAVPAHRFQKIYQDPVAAFAPTVLLRRSLGDVIARHGVAWTTALRLMQRMRVPENLLDRRPDQVSGGELQRIALVRALLVEPVFVFADEVTSRLDLVTQKGVMELLREIVVERQLALLMVTHDRDLARGMAPTMTSLGDEPARSP